MTPNFKHIQHAILAKPFSDIYKINKYWGRKPWNIYHAFIKNYSKEDDIILDPFCGSGVSVIESLKLNRRKVIGLDINPYAIFLTEQSILPIDLLNFELCFRDINSEIEIKIKREYSTPCRACRKMADVIHYVWGRDPLPKGTPAEKGTERELLFIKYICPFCGNQNQVKPISFDFDLLLANFRSYSERILSELDISIIKELKITRKTEANSYYDLFTDRNFYLILIIYKAISNIDDSRLRDAFKCVFLSSLAQSSKLLMYTQKGAKVGFKSKSWVAPRFHIQRNFLEKNPLMNFKNSFIRNYKAKKESNKLLLHVKPTSSLDDIYSGKANVLLKIDNGEFLNQIGNEKIDYVITDPPFMKSIKYLELSQLWNNFLGNEVDWQNEIKLVSKTKSNIANYSESLKRCFSNIYNLTKPNHNITLNYQADDIDLWDVMINVPVESGFKLENISLQSTRYSYGGKFRELHTNKTSTVPFLGGYYFTTFSKLVNRKESNRNISQIKKEVVNKAKDIIVQRGELTPSVILLKAVLEHLAQLNFSLPNAYDVLNYLKENEDLFESDRYDNELWLNWSLKILF